jgi:hypothetical protein
MWKIVWLDLVYSWGKQLYILHQAECLVVGHLSRTVAPCFVHKAIKVIDDYVIIIQAIFCVKVGD